MLKLTQLVALSLLDTQVHESYLTNLSNLTHLSTHYNDTDDTPYEHSFSCKGLSELPNLISLSLPPSGIDSEKISKLTSIKHLQLYDHDGDIDDESISKLTNLISLDISLNSKISNDSITNFTNLTSLDLSYNDTGITNEGLSTLTNLTALNLSNNRLITKEGLLTLTNLTSLNIEDNDLIDIFDLTHLTKLVFDVLDDSIEFRIPKELRLMDTIGTPPWAPHSYGMKAKEYD